jgi:hypothetical protein
MWAPWRAREMRRSLSSVNAVWRAGDRIPAIGETALAMARPGHFDQALTTLYALGIEEYLQALCQWSPAFASQTDTRGRGGSPARGCSVLNWRTRISVGWSFSLGNGQGIFPYPIARGRGIRRHHSGGATEQPLRRGFYGRRSGWTYRPYRRLCVRKSCSANHRELAVGLRHWQGELARRMIASPAVRLGPCTRCRPDERCPATCLGSRQIQVGP